MRTMCADSVTEISTRELAMAIFQSQNASTDTSALPDETYGSGRKCVGSGECPIARLEEKWQQNGAAAMVRSFL